MFIDEDKCIGCGMCIPYCPAGAIHIANRKALIDYDLCVECGNCKFAGVCKKDAIHQQTMDMPREIRAIFSNPRRRSPNTGIPGRGTQEMKTNDVTNRYPKGLIGFSVEMGRPCTCTDFKDVETIAKIVVAHGARLETCNPSFLVFREDEPGVLKDEFRNERALSFIIEGFVTVEMLPGLIADLKDAQSKVNTVFSIDVITQLEDGENPVYEYLRSLGAEPRPNGKTNLGMGRCAGKEP